MLTTEGYRDILHIARHKKPLNFSNYQDLPWQRYPIVRRRDRLTVPERITETAPCSCPSTRSRLASRYDSRRPASTRWPSASSSPSSTRARGARGRDRPRGVPEAFLSSSEVLPQYREYERFSTVCLNAYVGPKVAGYVSRLREELRALDVRTHFHLMTSASGVATPDAVSRPVNLLMSGA